jgi:hypothetical protein
MRSRPRASRRCGPSCIRGPCSSRSNGTRSAARLHELERIVDAGEQESTEAIAEIRATAEAEAGL